MRTKAHLYLAVTFLCLLAVRAEVKEFTFDFSVQKMDVASASVNSFAIGDTINLTLPEDQPSFSLEIVAAPPAGIAGPSYIAKDMQGQASAVVKPTKDGLRITVDDFEHQKIYSVRVQDGIVKTSVHDTSGSGGDVCGTCGGDLALPPPEQVPVETNAASAATPRTARLKAAMLGAGDAFPFAEQKKVVDILVAFDQGAKARCTELGFDGINDFADYAVNKMNMVLVQSQLDDLFCYRLVGVVEIDDAWNKINDALLGSLRSREGSLAKLSQLREKYGADTITLVVNKTEGSTTGIAYGYYLSAGYDVPSKFDNQNYACNVCNINTVYSRYTMSHETGHNMGCGHSNRQGNNSGPGRYSDSCGYHFTDANGVRRCTVMAYTNTGDDNYYYDPVPYFSTPEISPAEYGCVLGVEGVNNNRRTLTLTYADIAGLREHVVPYDWDVRVWEGQRELAEGDYCEYDNYGNHTLSLTHTNSDAVIYYTLDGSVPNTLSEHIRSGETISVNLEQDRTMKVCAVIGNAAQSVRTLTLREGIAWSGEHGQSGNGRWSADQNILSWCDGERSYEKWATVIFPDNVQNQSISIAVIGEIAPWSTAFTAIDSAYTFNKNDAESLLKFRDAAFAPSGDLTFNVPVQMSATSFTTPAGGTVAFNAPFGQVLESSGGYCTNSIVVGNGGTLVVAPGSGKTQVFDSFNNTGTYWNTATFRVGTGTVRFNGPINSGKGLFGSTKIVVGNGGNLVFDVGGATGSDVSSTFTVSAGGTVTFNAMEHMRRKLILDGGTVRCKRLDLMYGTTISATADSSIAMNGGDGYVWIRFADATVDVANGATLTLDVPITTGYNTANFGFVKTGGGEMLANKPMSHTGATVISNGTVAIGYSSSTRVGLGWTVKNGATLKLKSGCSLAVPTLALESGATLAMPAAASAPLSATNEVNLSGVRLLLDGASDLSQGKSYPLVASSDGFAGISSVVTDGLPALADGLMWEAEVDDGTLYAKVVRNALNIPAGTTVNFSDVPSTVATVTGEGTLLCNGGDLTADRLAALRGYVANGGWKGTVAFTNYVATTLALDWYGNANSTVRLTGVSGYPGNSGNTNIYFHTTVELVDGADGKPAWTLNNGFSTDCTFIDRLRGDGTLKSTLSPSITYVRQGFVVADASGFTGSLDLVGTQFTFGSTARKNDSSQTGTIYVDAGCSVTNAALWKSPALVINGELVKKGTLTIADSVVFGNGASFVVDSLPVGGVVLTSKTITTNGVLSVGVMDDSRSYVAAIIDNGDSTASLVFKKAPLPATVNTSIAVRYWGDDGWEDRALSFDLPTAWVTNYYPSLDTPEAVAAKYNETAANGATVWQSYMLGLDPTNTASTVSLSMVVEGNEIRFAVEGLGEPHALEGINVYWYMKTSTNLVTDASFSKTRDTAQGLSPTFPVHPMPDKPTAGATQTVDKLFYKITVTFVAEDE